MVGGWEGWWEGGRDGGREKKELAGPKNSTLIVEEGRHELGG